MWQPKKREAVFFITSLDLEGFIELSKEMCQWELKGFRSMMVRNKCQDGLELMCAKFSEGLTNGLGRVRKSMYFNKLEWQIIF